MADLDDYFRYLADRQRRRLLYHLADEDVTTVEELAATLAESSPGAAAGPAGDVDEVALALRHHHLPKLDDLSVVEYDRPNGVVEVGDIPAELETLLHSTRELELAD